MGLPLIFMRVKNWDKSIQVNVSIIGDNEKIDLFYNMN